MGCRKEVARSCLAHDDAGGAKPTPSGSRRAGCTTRTERTTASWRPRAASAASAARSQASAGCTWTMTTRRWRSGAFCAFPATPSCAAELRYNGWRTPSSTYLTHRRKEHHENPQPQDLALQEGVAGRSAPTQLDAGKDLAGVAHMTGTSHHGHHDVRAFVLPLTGATLTLQDGWKPFAYQDGYVICRKYVRNEKESNGS